MFLTLVIGTGCALAAMVLLVQFNLGRGLLSYINQNDADRLNRLSIQFAEQYEATGSWEFARDQRVWRRMTSEGPNGRPPRRSGPPDRRRRAERAPERLSDIRGPEAKDRPRSPPRGRRGPRGGPGPLAFGPRVSLFDSNGQRIMGSTRRHDGPVFRSDITVDEKMVGWLSVRQADELRNARDINFLRQQSRSLLWVGLGLLGLTGLLALVFSRQLVGPVSRIAQTVQRMAGGDYQARITVTGRDELADLSTDINTLANSLDENQQARQQWIADISHELRTPLAIIRGELEALKEGVRPIDGKAIESLHTEAMNLARLVDDLHQLSMSDAGSLNYDMQPLDLTALVSQTTDRFADRISESGLSLSFQSVPGALTVHGDATRLQQLFSNLFENSLRYTDTGGRIDVALTRDDVQGAVVTFQDTAPGVPDGMHQRLFERLYRIESSRNRQRGGSGLGLSICRNIVHAHGGAIVASPSDLGGLKIIIALPCL